MSKRPSNAPHPTQLNRAMRIGTNHGSMSSRVLSFYGDTPRGMVESAIEFADICRSQVRSCLVAQSPRYEYDISKG